MERFKKWFLSIVRNNKHHKSLRTDLNNTRTDLNKLLDFHLRKITPMAFLEVVEIQLAEHCNLNCFGCNHFSQIAQKEFLSLETFTKDLTRLSEISKGFIGNLRLMGGEPLLNPNCIEFFSITRELFPQSAIWLVTNGILLPKQNDDFYDACHKNNIEIRPTKYPINIDWQLVEDKCKEHKVALTFFNEGQVEKTSVKFTLDPKGLCDNYHSFTRCEMANHCVQLKNGRLFTCPPAAHIEHFNKKYEEKFEVSELDSIDIYKAKDYQEILSFLAKPIPFCRYCKVSQWAEVGPWRASKYKKDEYLEV